MSEQKGAYRIALGESDAVGGVVKVQNPEGVDLLIPSGGLVLDVTTKTTGACTLDAGIDDDGADSVDNLIDGLDVGTAAGVFDNGADKGTNGGPYKWGATDYLVISKATGAAAGLVGYAYVDYIRE